MLCVSKIIDILSWAEAGFKLDARFCTFFLDQFHSSFLVLAPCLTVSDSACSAGHVATAAIHAAGCIAAGCTCEFSDCPCPFPCAAAPPLLTPPLSCAPSSSPQLLAAAPRRSSSPQLLAAAPRRRSSPPLRAAAPRSHHRSSPCSPSLLVATALAAPCCRSSPLQRFAATPRHSS
jgi:hypothetical protein